MSLTWNMSGILEGFSDFRIKINEQIFLNRDFLISLLDFIFDPICKVIPSNGVGHINDPLLWQLLPIY